MVAGYMNCQNNSCKFKSTACLRQTTAIRSSIKSSSKTETNIQFKINQMQIPKILNLMRESFCKSLLNSAYL